MNTFSADTFPTHKILISNLEIDRKVMSKIYDSRDTNILTVNKSQH